MSTIGIVTDSHSGITKAEAQRLGIKVLPMPFYVGEECYYEDVTLTRQEFYQKLKENADISTSQPSPADVMDIWNEALREFDEIIYIPISSGLSGSCQTAISLSGNTEYKGKVYVVDNGRVSTPMHRSVLDALELVKEGYSAADIKRILEAARANMVIYVGVQTLDNLKKGGRISTAAAAVATVLNIKPVLRFDVGNLDVYKKCRGFAAAKKAMLEAVKEDLNTKFKTWYDAGRVHILAASSSEKEDTDEWVREIKDAFPGMEVMCDDLSLGVSCHIGYGGLGIAVSCYPDR